MPLITATVCLLALQASPQQPTTKTATTKTATVIIGGRVVDMRGAGVPVAEVWIKDPDNQDKSLRHTVTDAEGFFRLPRVPDARSRWVFAVADGYCVGSGSTNSKLLANILVHEATTIRGVVHNVAGDPVAGIAITMCPIGRTLRRRQVSGTTDKHGQFTIERVPLGPAHVCAWVPGEGLAELAPRIRGNDELLLQASSAPTTAFAITVDGLPSVDSPEITVAWSPYRSGSYTILPPPHMRPTFRGKSWTAEGLPDWSYTVRLRAEGWSFLPSETRVKPGQGPHKFSFQATRLSEPDKEDSGVRCNAVVKDANDDPVAGVPFVLRQSNGGAKATAVSDAKGGLVFDSPLAPGTKVIVIATSDHWVIDQDKTTDMFGASDRRFVEWHECIVDPQRLLQLRVVPAMNVTGRLLRHDGRAAAFTDLQLETCRDGMDISHPRWTKFAYATTDLDGDYAFKRLHHSPPDVRIVVDSLLGSATSEPFSFAKVGDKIKVPDIKLSAPATIEGVVRDTNNKPAPGATVWLRKWDLVGNRQRSGSITEVVTDRRGRYRFLGVEIGGAYLQLVVDPKLFRHRQVVEPFDVEAGKTYTFDIEEK